MRTLLGLVGLLAVLLAGYRIYLAQVGPADSRASVRQIELVHVRTDLLAFAQAERLYLSANGRYGTLEELRQSGNLNLPPDSRDGEYLYEADVDRSSHFRITATPSAAGTGLPVLSVDETMRITQ